MGDAAPDEHLRIFKCLIDTGSDVLRNAMETKLLVNNTIKFEQYLLNRKHQFYHQYEKNTNNPCCIGNVHGCNVKGNMDKNIFTKVYNKMAEQDTKLCLDRYEIKPDICVDDLDLSDINFFLWNSKTLSNSEKSSLQAIMKTRSIICHTSSTQKYSITELENIWISLENDVLLFAEPHRYKTTIKREISLLRNNKLNMTDTAKITNVLRTEIDKILKESQTNNESIESQLKDGLVEFKNLLVDERSTSKINDKLHELMETNKNNCKRTEEMKDELMEDSLNTRNHSERQFKSFETTLTENKENHHQALKRCSEGIGTIVTQEGISTRNHNKEQIHVIDTNLTECEKRVCQTVSQSQGLVEDKIREEANETRKHSEGLHSDLIEENRRLTEKVMKMETDINEVKTILIGMTGNQKIQLEMNCEQMEKLVTTRATKEIYMTGKVHQTCLTEDKARQVIENIQSELEVPTGATRKEIVTIIAKKVNSIILEMKSTPGILESVKNLKLAILTIVQNMQMAGDIDTGIEDTVTVQLCIESPLTLAHITVLKCLFTNEQTVYLPESTIKEAKRNSNPKAILPQMKYWRAAHPKSKDEMIKTPCKLCEDKNTRIQALEEQNDEKHERLEKFKLNYVSIMEAVQAVKSTFEIPKTRVHTDNKLVQTNMTTEDIKSLTAEISKLQATSLINPLRDDIGMISKTGKLEMKQNVSKSSLVSQHTYGLHNEDSKLRDLLRQTHIDDTGMLSDAEKLGLIQKDIKSHDISSLKHKLTHYLSSKTEDECRNCYEKDEIIIQLDRRLCEIRRRVIEAKKQSVSGNNFLEDLLQFILQTTNMTSVEEKERMTYKELKSGISSKKSELISDVDVRDPEKKANKKLMESQASQGRRPELDQTEEKSELSLRISEIRREYASNYYTKTDKQKGLGIIVQGKRSRYVQHDIDPDTAHLQEFFEEIGFVVECTDGSYWGHLLQYMTNENLYSVFFVFKDYWDHDDKYLIRQLLSQRNIGKPVIFMTDFHHPVYFIDENNENNDILIVNPTMQASIGSYRHPGYKNTIDDFMKVTRSNRFADIIDILIRINSLYDYPVITFQSTLRKKLSFL